MTKAYSYIRFSRLKELDPKKIKYQLDEAKEFARSKNLVFDETLSFQDLGVSGFKGLNKKAGKLGLFLFAIRHGIVAKGSYLIIENLDRLSREGARHALRVLEEIVDHGITVVTMGDRKEYTAETLDKDPTDLIYSILIFIRGNEESLTKSRRLRASWARQIEAARKGERTKMMGGYPSWLTYKDGKFFVKEGAAKLIKQIFEMTKVGMGAAAIASRLNTKAIPTVTGLPTWNGSIILHYLRNPSVTGRFVPRTKKYVDGQTITKVLPPIDDFYPRIISENLWRLVQKEIDFRRSKRPAFWNGSHKKTKNIFGKLNLCECCGGLMTRRMKNLMISPMKETHPYLICAPLHRAKKCDFRPVLYYPIHHAFLSKGIKMIDDHYKELLEREEIKGLDNDNLERALLVPKMDNVKSLIAQPEIDRRKLNKALINLFSGIVIWIDKGDLQFIWAYGGISELSFLKENNKYTEKLIRDLVIKPV